MKKIIYLILLIVAVAANAQDITFSNTEGRFCRQIPLNEIRSMLHTIGNDSVGLVNVESRNGAIYSTFVDTLNNTPQMATTQVEDILSTGRFASMQRVKSFDSLDELELGDFVGVFNEDDYNIEEFLNKSFSILNTLDSSGILMAAMVKADSLYAALLATANGTIVENLRIHVADIVYVGEDMNGQKIPLSARIIYPYDITNNKLTLTNLYIDNHPTIFTKGNEPTTNFSGYSQCSVCLRGYLVIQPDLIGFGASEDRTQLYVDANLNGSAVAYSVVAAQQFADWAAARERYGFSLSDRVSIINTGASQGASTALSGTYYMENKLDTAKYSIPPILDTRLCAGAYNLELCMNEFCKADTLTYASKLPLLVAGAVTDYRQIFRSFSVHDYFAPKMKDYEYCVTDTTTGEITNYGTIWQILHLKEANSSIIETALVQAFHSDTLTTYPSFHKMLAADMFNADGTLNWSLPKLVTLKKFLTRNNFASKDMWTPKSTIHMFHAPNDDIIPYSTALEFYTNQNTTTEAGTNRIILHTMDGVPNLALGSYGVHLMTCFLWFFAEASGLPAETINELMKLIINIANTEQVSTITQ